MTPTVVISAFNRPASLRRLLASLGRATYSPQGRVRLVISVDAGDTAARAETVSVAHSAEWPFGPKDVIAHTQPLGLIGNVFFCLGLTQTYGDVIHLEDDFSVGRSFYAYASQALSFYRDDDRIANVSLYALWFNGYTHEPFVPLPDDGDVFFLNMPFIQGQAWTREGWGRFDRWRAQHDPWPSVADGLHPMFERFPKTDWYPMLAKYAVTTGRFTVYPRVSLCVGMGETGTHFTRRTAFFHTPLQESQSDFRFKRLDDSLAVYDSFFELQPNRMNRLTDVLQGFDYDMDLYATKAPRHLRTPHVLTTRPCARAERSFGLGRWPMEMNVADAVPGHAIALCRKETLRWGPAADWSARWRKHRYFTHGRRLPLMLVLRELLDRVKDRNGF
jgi:hypothetical protein